MVIFCKYQLGFEMFFSSGYKTKLCYQFSVVVFRKILGLPLFS